MLDNTNDRWASSDTNALSDCSGGEGKLLSRVLAVVAGCPSVVPKLWHAPEIQSVGSTPRVSDSAGLGTGPRICIPIPYSPFPEAAAAFLRAAFHRSSLGPGC